MYVHFKYTLHQTNSTRPWKLVLGRWSGFLLEQEAYFQGRTVAFREGKTPKCWMISIFTIHTWEILTDSTWCDKPSGALSELEEFEDWTKEIPGPRPAVLKGEEWQRHNMYLRLVVFCCRIELLTEGMLYVFFFVWWWAIPELCFFSSLFWGAVLGLFWRQKTQRCNLKPHQFFPLVFLPFSKNEARTFFPFCQTACVCSVEHVFIRIQIFVWTKSISAVVDGIKTIS